METVAKIIGPFILSQMTPAIKEGLATLLRDLYQRCKETPNPWDNMAISFVCGLLGIELEG